MATSGQEQELGTDQERVGALLHEAHKDRIDLGVEDLDFPPDGRSPCPKVGDLVVGLNTARIDEHAKALGMWQEFMQEP
jgi:hypothetical protein